MRVTMELPDQVARQWGDTPDAVGRHVMEDAAIEGYRAGRLSHRQVGEMLSLAREINAAAVLMDDRKGAVLPSSAASP